MPKSTEQQPGSLVEGKKKNLTIKFIIKKKEGPQGSSVDEKTLSVKEGPEGGGLFKLPEVKKAGKKSREIVLLKDDSDGDLTDSDVDEITPYENDIKYI